MSATAERIEKSGGDGTTRALAAWTANVRSDEITDRARARAAHAILDWLGVTLGGASDPLVDILVADAIDEGRAGESTLVGRPERLVITQAALVNGAASHALDFDDVNEGLHGHPTVAVTGALLAAAESRGSSGREVLDAYVVGCEVACLLGRMMGNDHYERGWHSTATVGTFGAAAAASRILGLDADRTAMALGIAATLASGLKSMFGTMCKPLHAGRTSMNGLLAARWAARGFTSNPEGIECHQGFGPTQSGEFQPLPIRPDRKAPFAAESNLFKYHAACYLTHSSIEAVRRLREEHDLRPEDVECVHTHVLPSTLNVCNIPSPRTGLEVKFSLRHTIAMALAGEDTGDSASYTDENANRGDLVAARERVSVEPHAMDSRYGSEVVIDLRDGRHLSRNFDVGVPERDDDLQWRRLSEKFSRLAEPVVGTGRASEIVAAVAALDGAAGISDLLGLTRTAARG